MPEMYLVGGAVRDIILGGVPKDYDFVVQADSFEHMVDWLMREKSAEIFLTKPEFGTARASISPTVFPYVKYPVGMKRVAADFVLARKDGYYSDGRHPDSVESGTLFDDLARRDFTINAIAMGAGGQLIDPHNGRVDILRGILRTVGDPVERLEEDALRVVRALRFAVTKGFVITGELREAMQDANVIYNLQYKISPERVREELLKMFKHDTLMTLRLLEHFPLLRVILLDGDDIWLKPTTEGR